MVYNSLQTDYNPNSYTMIIKGPVYVGIFVQGTSVRRVRVRSYWRVRNGKKVFVRAHWRFVEA